MNNNPKGLIYILSAVGLIIIGIVTTAIINAVKNTNQSASGDIRARAAVTNTLKLTGTVSEVIDIEGMIIVSNVQFADTSRSGTAKNYGTWKVLAPSNFPLTSAVVDSPITFSIDAKSFNVSTKSVVASQITIGK